MKKLRTLIAFTMVLSSMLTFTLALEPVIVFADASPSQSTLSEPQPVWAVVPLAEEPAADIGGAEPLMTISEWPVAVFGEVLAYLEPEGGEPAQQIAGIRTVLIGDTTYVSLRDFTTLQDTSGETNVTFQNGKATVSQPGNYLEFYNGGIYYYANGRVLPINRPCFVQDGCFYVPVRALSLVYSYDISWDGQTQTATLTKNDKRFLSGDEFYDPDDYYWLAQIINAESGNEPFEGKIAVGNVILNRVRSPQFPDTIYDVIFDNRNGTQFTPTANGAIYRTPNEESRLAAKLCLEGYCVTADSLYFFNPRTARSNWIRNNRTYVAAIGSHVFYS